MNEVKFNEIILNQWWYSDLADIVFNYHSFRSSELEVLVSYCSDNIKFQGYAIISILGLQKQSNLHNNGFYSNPSFFCCVCE